MPNKLINDALNPPQIIGLNAYMVFAWMDEKLQWNPSDYGGLSKISLGSDR